MLEPRPTIESESRQLEAVIDAVGGRAAIFASSCCCLAASQLAVRDPLKVELVETGHRLLSLNFPQLAVRSAALAPTLQKLCQVAGVAILT